MISYLHFTVLIIHIYIYHSPKLDNDNIIVLWCLCGVRVWFSIRALQLEISISVRENLADGRTDGWQNGYAKWMDIFPWRVLDMKPCFFDRKSMFFIRKMQFFGASGVAWCFYLCVKRSKVFYKSHWIFSKKWIIEHAEESIPKHFMLWVILMTWIFIWLTVSFMWSDAFVCKVFHKHHSIFSQ